MDKKTERRSILSDDVYEAKLAEARAKREERHTKAKENTTIAVRTAKVWVISHS